MLVVSRHYVELSQAVYFHDDERLHLRAEGVGCQRKAILGERGQAAIHFQSVRTSHPALPVFLYALVGVVVASNGALLRIWGELLPIALWIFNCKYSQTRKSRLTSNTSARLFAEFSRTRVTRVTRVSRQR